MTPLSHRQWMAIHQLALKIQAAGSRDELVQLAIRELPGVIGAGYTCWNEHRVAIELETVEMLDDHKGEILSLIPEINALRDTHPVVANLMLMEENLLAEGIHSLTDFVSERELRHVPIWQEVYRKVEAKHQLFTQFHMQDGCGVILTINGDRRFTLEQKAMLECLREHFVAACGRVLTRSLAEGRLKEAILREAQDELSNREREVLPHILEGKTDPEIAVVLGISARTVEKHTSSLLRKFSAENRRSLMVMFR